MKKRYSLENFVLKKEKWELLILRKEKRYKLDDEIKRIKDIIKDWENPCWYEKDLWKLIYIKQHPDKYV